MTVWVVTLEWGWASSWSLQGVHSSLEKAQAWVEAQCADSAGTAVWTAVRDGAVWLYGGYCVYRVTVDGEEG